MTDLPLDGVTVVALEQAVAAPLATRHLADLGARVIKIERIGEGDFARNYDRAVGGMASHFVWLNRGKESIALDLKSRGGVAVAHRLIESADVFVQNSAPGAAARLGLDPAALAAADPALITASITGYGDDGPFCDRKAYDLLIQAETGLVSLTGTPDAASKTGVPSSDIAAGMYLAQSILAALFRKARTGRGAVLDVSMFDATAEWIGHPMYVQMHTGELLPRRGLGHASIVPYDSYPTADGQLLIGVQNDRGWRALMAGVLERPDVADDPRFVSNTDRVAHRAECDTAVAAETVRFTGSDLSSRLEAAGVPSAVVNDVAGLVDHPQLSERDRWRTVTTPVGPVRGLLPPMGFADVELPMGDVPALGAHSRALLTELGYDAADSEQLVACGVVGVE
ncbi:CoA transferase [Gordonia sp. HY002]|uniref:CaiB/BaiF CoA transferase family protein n=1 Tax=Gordonia zhenghanii TaxID=2911516 RepID=UPI001EF05CDD|nr:CaiB/BaiF CoA-transferase family protein [Gordonia zhenghanii]MCF8571787.1 CoA transferase [Gordonia zhenghanii]MCF8604799.1 CoA transferase [Gordonia zhenghanii]